MCIHIYIYIYTHVCTHLRSWFCEHVHVLKCVIFFTSTNIFLLATLVSTNISFYPQWWVSEDFMSVEGVTPSKIHSDCDFLIGSCGGRLLGRCDIALISSLRPSFLVKCDCKIPFFRLKIPPRPRVLPCRAVIVLAGVGYELHMGLSENSVPLHPIVNDHYPY